jgi:hypothetical protein
LRNENSRLERSNHSLTKATNFDADLDSGNVTNSPKRKARAASPVRTAKRRKGDEQVERTVAETRDEIDEDMDFLDSLGQGKTHTYRVTPVR